MAPWYTVSPEAAAALILLAVLAPLALALFAALPRTRAAATRLLPVAALPALAVSAGSPSGLEIPGMLLGLRLGSDAIGSVFLLFTAILWLLAGWFAVHYMAQDERRARHAVFLSLAMAGNFGLILAQDIASFYFFFAMMSFSSYVLVIHDGRDVSMRAGRVYLALAILGELLQFAAFSLLVMNFGSAALPDVPAALANAERRELIIILLIAGFGVKAGLLPLHVWLPLAHPVAPTPASAVLSGAMIKAGLLGWIRFLPFGVSEFPVGGGVGWVPWSLHAWPAAGEWMIALGIVGSLGAALVGVTQRHPKAVLAYSSISQMGLMIVLTGVALADRAAAPYALAAALLYAVHHGLAKGALFLAVGMATSAPGAKCGQRWILGGCAFLGLALAGAPGTSGMLAKMGLKKAAGMAPEGWAADLGLLLSIGAIGTTLLMARFLVRLHALMNDPHEGHGHAASRWIWAPWILSVVASGTVVWTLLPELTQPYTGQGYAAKDLLKLAWPVAAGSAIAAVAWRARRGKTPLPEAPAGDLLAVYEFALRIARGVLLAVFREVAELAARLAATQRSVGQAVSHRAGLVDRWEAHLNDLSWAGAILVLLAVVFGVLWR